MFTGIVTEMGRIEEMRRSSAGAGLRIACALAGAGLTAGESVSVTGVCLTVEACDGHAFAATASPETLRRTTLERLRPGDRVNLERALSLGARLGGHLVQGHVDGTGRVRSVRPEGVSRILALAAPESLLSHLVDRGSVAVDGVSLTVTGLDAGAFSVTLIPATLEATTLAGLQAGDAVNLEADIISKYVARQMEALGLTAAGPRPAAWLGSGGRD